MSHEDSSKFEQQKFQIEATQFVFTLDPRTLLPIEFAAPIIGRTTLTFRTNVTRRPESLPKLTKIGGRVFVRVQDLMDFIDPDSIRDKDTSQDLPTMRRRGRPPKRESLTNRASEK